MFTQCDIRVSTNGGGNYCVVEAEIQNSTCNELAVNILLYLQFVIFLLNGTPPLIEPPALIELNLAPRRSSIKAGATVYCIV